MSRIAGVWQPLLGIALAIWALLSFGAIGRAFYGDYRLPQGSGMNHLLPEELAFYAMFFVFGTLVTTGLWLSLRATTLPERLLAGVRALAGAGWIGAVVAAALVTATCALIGRDVLRHAVISDDEHVYQFIAQTLRSGHLTAPSPQTDLAFFREQFVVLTPSARFGKYPIGHPLLLALGQATGLEAAVVPVITGLLGVVAYAVGRAVGGAATACVTLLLFATSPQVLLTGATLLSQPTAALCVAVAVLGLFLAEQPQPSGLAGASLAGVALAFGILARPLPVALFVPAGAAYVLWTSPRRVPAAATRLAVFVAPLAGAALVMLLVNRAQVGHALLTAYVESLAPGAGPAGILMTTTGTAGMRAMSLVGSLIRLNFWLLGWPVSLAFVLLAGSGRRIALLWAMVAGALLYRVLTPKVGVGGVGPIYFFEVAVPLCVLAAAGLIRLMRTARHPLLSRASLSALVVSAVVVNVAAFLPSRLADLRRMGAAQNLVGDLIRDQGVSHALVFHESVVPGWTRLSWAYYPRVNAPGLDDDVLFVLLQREHGLPENVEFWKRRYPDRSAWYFGYFDGRPMLVPLEALLGGAAGVEALPPAGSATRQ